MSSIAVSLVPDALPIAQTEPQPANGWQPDQVALRAWNASLDMLASVATVVIAVGVFMWWAIPLVLVLLWLAVRARRRPTSTTTPPPPSAPAAPATPTGGTWA